MAKVEDDFLYPIPVAGGTVNNADGLRLTNAFDAVLSLYQHAGAIPKQRFNHKEESAEPSTPTTAPKSGGNEKSVVVDGSGNKVVKMDDKIKAGWFKYHERVIPGGVMKLVESITIPTPKGWITTTAARVNQVFEKRFLIEFESKEVLSQFTYTELDELRFAYTCVFDLITGGMEAINKTQVSVANSAAASSSSAAATASASAANPNAAPSFYAAQTAQAAQNSKVFENMWNLQGLAKRDIKKNCESSGGDGSGGPSSSSAAAAGSSSSAAAPVVVAGKAKAGVAKGGTGSSGLVRTDAAKERPKLDAEKKHAKALLEDECKKLWPYAPFSKAAVFTLEQDPKQPRHKPLYKCIVELSNMNKRKVEGPWMGNKKDAEDGASEVVLKFLYTSAFGKK